MITDIWRLMIDVEYDEEEEDLIIDEGELAGVRVKRDTGEYYDVDIDTFMEHGQKIDLNLLGMIPLELYNDSYVSEDEIYSGLVVNDGSENDVVLHDIRTYNPSDDARYRQAKQQRRFRINKLIKDYEGVIPFNLRVAFGDFLHDHMAKSTEYWGFFNDKQAEILRDYFKWATKMIYKQATQDKPLTATMNKSLKLIEIMGDSLEWEYAGTLDTGYFGGGQCTLGHAVRYEHNAYDRKTGKTVIFGQKCFSDFFELDERIVASIVSAQKRLSLEMVVIAFLTFTKRTNDICPTFVDKKEFAEYKDELSPVKRRWVKWADEFKKENIPLSLSFATMKRNIERDIQKAKANQRSMDK